MKVNTGLASVFGLFLLATTSPANATIPPSPVHQDSPVPWSKVVEDPFDGKIVYDKDFGEGYAIVSSWSKQGVRLSYFWTERQLDYYRRVQRTRKVKRDNQWQEEVYWDQEPVYKYIRKRKSPEKILFAIGGKIYEYEGGVVSDELARALISLPDQKLLVRLVWADGSTTDFYIGSATVRAWKSIYSP